MKIKLLLLTILNSMVFIVSSQNNNVSTGGGGTGSGGSIEYSVGQVDYITTSTNTGTISQGVQQSFEIYITADLKNNESSKFCEIYPNPLQDFLVVKLPNSISEENTFLMYNESGKLIKNQTLLNGENLVEVRDVVKGIYFIEISDKNKNTINYKIVKN